MMASINHVSQPILTAVVAPYLFARQLYWQFCDGLEDRAKAKFLAARPHVEIRIARAWLDRQDPDFRFSTVITSLISGEFGVSVSVDLVNDLAHPLTGEPQDFSVESTDSTIESDIIDWLYSEEIYQCT